MYFSALSASSARKAKAATSKKSDDNEKQPLSSVKLAEPGEPFIYTKETNSIPREVMLDYLNTCTAMLLTDDTLRMVIDISANTHLSLHMCLMEFQRQLMENNFHIEKVFGCGFMSNIPTHFAGDTIMIATAKRFMFICSRAYLNALKLRKKESYVEKNIPIRVGNSASTPMGLSRSEIFEFFEGCNCLSMFTNR